MARRFLIARNDPGWSFPPRCPCGANSSRLGLDQSIWGAFNVGTVRPGHSPTCVSVSWKGPTPGVDGGTCIESNKSPVLWRLFSVRRDHLDLLTLTWVTVVASSSRLDVDDDGDITDTDTKDLLLVVVVVVVVVIVVVKVKANKGSGKKHNNKHNKEVSRIMCM